MKILIYEDYVHNNALLYRALRRHAGSDAVSFCDADDVLNGILSSGIALLVMPGGADLYYAEKLNGAGNAAIRAYVRNGGSYLGICAGAYYACASLSWAKGTDQEISGPRELTFFDGEAAGPVGSLIEDGDVSKSWHAAPVLSYDDGSFHTETKVHYEAGPVFTDGTNAKILARYADLPGQPAAIIECAVGAGRAILSGPHIENIYSDLVRGLYRNGNPSYDRDRQVFDALKDDESLSRKLWSAVLDRCINPHHDKQNNTDPYHRRRAGGL